MELPGRLAALLVEMLLVAVAEEHAGEGGVAGRGVEQGAGDMAEPAGRARPLGLGLLHDGGTPALRAAEHLVQQMFLAAEMAIDRAFGHARPGRDGGGGGGPEADGGIELECCTKQPLAGGLTVTAHGLGRSHIAK